MVFPDFRACILVGRFAFARSNVELLTLIFPRSQSPASPYFVKSSFSTLDTGRMLCLTLRKACASGRLEVIRHSLI